MPTLVVLAVITVAVGRDLRSVPSRHAAKRVAPPTSGEAGTAAPAIAPSTLLLVHRGADGRADLLTVGGVSTPKKRGPTAASILLIPSATQVETPSLGIQILADLPNLGDAKLLTTTIENLLGVALTSSIELDDTGLAAVLAPAAPLPVRLRAPVRIADRDSETAIPAGDQTLSASDAARVITAHESGSELDHLVTVQAVLEGWQARLRDRSIAQATEAIRPGLAVMTTAAKARERVDSLSVDSFTTGGGERFQPRRDDITDYVRTAFPAALLGPGGKRPRVEILNGTGAVGLAQQIAAVVVPAGGDVRLTGNVPGFGVPTTQVVYYRDQDRPAAEHLLAALKCGGLKRADTALGMVDVTILVGADCKPSS